MSYIADDLPESPSNAVQQQATRQGTHRMAAPVGLLVGLHLSLVGFHLGLMAQRPLVSAEPPQRKPALTVQADSSGVLDVVYLNHPNVTESSGLAVSRRRDGYFWTHNDSGDGPRLYAFNSRGEATGQVHLSAADSLDWEDMASFADEGTPRLLVADCGDNGALRDTIALYLIDEPDPRKSTLARRPQIIQVRYPDGPKDCEAAGVDTHRRQVVLITKSALPLAGIYVVPLPPRADRSSRGPVTAKRIGTLPLPMVTAMDISDPSGDIHLVSYFQAFRFPCTHRDMPIAQQLKQLPVAGDLPRWKQIEAIAIDGQGNAWVTSEGDKAPLGRLANPSARR